MSWNCVLTDEVFANRASSLHAMLRLVSATAGRKLLLNVASLGSNPVEHELQKETYLDQTSECVTKPDILGPTENSWVTRRFLSPKSLVTMSKKLSTPV